MQSLRKTFFTVAVFLGSFSPYDFIQAEESHFPSSLEWRLQQLNHDSEATERLHRLFDLYWDWRMSENPEDATYLGYAVKQDQWSDLSTDAIHRRQHFSTQLLDILSSISTTHLNDEDQVSHRILNKLLEDDQIEYQFRNYYLLIDQMNGIHLSVPMIIEIMPHKTVKDYENVLSRLRNIPVLFQQAIQLLEQGIEAGITPPRIAIRHVPQQILNQIVENPLDSPLLQAFHQFPSSIDNETQIRLTVEAKTVYEQQVLPSLNQLYTYVIDRYLPNCRKTIAFSELPNGEAWYAHKARASTTTNLTPQEIHAIGLKEVERIHREMLNVIQAAEFKGTFKEFLQFLQTDPQFFYASREDLLKGYRALTRYIESKLPQLFAKLPHHPYEVIPVPSYSEESQIGAYYCPGSIADHRPGYFFINTSYPEQRPTWEMEPLALHEAVPGHHLQITIAQELQGLPEFRKNAFFTAYIEGWGLYAESLGSELGLYQNPYSIFGRLSYEMIRAIRLVVDTGMHAMGWSREQAFEFFKQYVGMSEHEIRTEIDRYLVMPGQALAYKIGELKIQEMRQLAAQTLGEKFDIRDFHWAWLRHGTVPLDVAEQHISQWMDHSLQTNDVLK